MENVFLKREREEFNQAEQAADAARNELLDLVQTRLDPKDQGEVIAAVFKLYRTANLEGITRMSLKMAQSQQRMRELENARR